jgi:hypothetical protein
MLPPGRARLATIPAPIGSPAVANTMGIDDVACFAARVGGVLCVRMMVTLRWTNSAAISLNRSVRPSPQRYSIVRLRSSLQPSSRSRCKSAAVHSLCAAAVPEPSNPMTGLGACCARAASGHRRRAAEQRDELAAYHSITSSAMASSVGGTSRPSALAVLRLMTRSYLVGAAPEGRPDWCP